MEEILNKNFQKYLSLKEKLPNTFLIFNFDIFYIFINEDAIKISSILSIKLTKSCENILTCGFLKSQISKYVDILNKKNINFEFVENNYLGFANKEKYIKDTVLANLKKEILNIDIKNTTPDQALSKLLKLKESLL